MACEPAPEVQPVGRVRLLRRRTVLVLGKSQVGKSHLCNRLCQYPGLFEEGTGINSCTLTPTQETFLLAGEGPQRIDYEVTLMDMPGLFDTRSREDNDRLMSRITEWIKYNMDTVHRIFYVFKKGPVSREEVQCMELIRQLLSAEVVPAGLCSLVVTHCDRLNAAARQEMVNEIMERSNLNRFMDMFRRDGVPQVITVDFSPDSANANADREALLQSILGAPQAGMHKTKVFRLYTSGVYATVELEEKKKIRAAMIATILADLKVENEGRSVCPVS